MRSLLFTLVLLFVLSSNFASSQNIDSIEYILDSAYSKSPFHVNILITKNSKIIFEKSYGCADAVLKKPLTKDNSFQVASISKQFTAYGIMLLHQKGSLHYDSTVRKYIPSFPYNNITVRHLLNHTSGLPEFWDEIRPNLDTFKSNGNVEMLEYLIQHKLPLQSPPGSKYMYCDIGYDLLANIIENISGMNYQKFMDKNIFKPLKMKSTFAYMVTDIRRIYNKNLAQGHKHENNTFTYAHLHPKNNFVFYLGDFYGDGSVVTTARDLAKWDKALKQCAQLPSTSQNEAFIIPSYNGQLVYTGSKGELGYGFGWFIRSDPAQGKIIYHTGFHPGNVHGIYRLIDKDMTFIFLSNAETSNIRTLRNRILRML